MKHIIPEYIILPLRIQFFLVLILLVLLSGCKNENDPKSKSQVSISFPADFLIGVSSSAYQIEGAHDEDGKGESNWDRFSNTPGKVEISGNIAADHYHRYKEDIELLKQLGVKTYRFSIAWTRILPDGTGKINQSGLDFYSDLVKRLRQNDIIPLVTLFHWDLPQKLEDEGGWTNRNTIEAFEEYTRVVVETLGPDVDWWTTFNEPWVTSFVGYWMGRFAPGQKDLAAALASTHNILVAHGKAVQIIRKTDPTAKVGITLDLQMALPRDSSNQEEMRAAKIINDSHHAWFADPIYFGHYPQNIVELYQDQGVTLPEILPGDMETIHQAVDYLGLNFYYTDYFTMAGDDGWWPYGVEQVKDDKRLYHDRSIDASGIYHLLRYLDTKYDHPPILITENGIRTDEDYINYKGEVNDEIRIEYVYKHLAQCRRAMNDGVNVIGYTNWCFLDDYEWGNLGRYGMVYVDFKTQERIIKKSGKWFARCISRNAFVLDY